MSQLHDGQETAQNLADTGDYDSEKLTFHSERCTRS